MFVCEERMASRDVLGSSGIGRRRKQWVLSQPGRDQMSRCRIEASPRPELVERTWKHDKARFCRPPSGKTYAVVRYRTLPCPPRPSKVVANERTFCEPWATPVTFYQHNIRYP
jgi:hypothetical protein